MWAAALVMATCGVIVQVDKDYSFDDGVGFQEYEDRTAFV